VLTLSATLRRLGFRVQHHLRGRVDAIVMIDPRKLSTIQFDAAEIAAYKQAHPHVPVLHRINECDQRKGSDFMDALLAEASRSVDFTVFVSEWLRDYHGERWFDRARPHAAILNGADPAVFHPFGGARWQPGEPLRVVTHHWSTGALKGFAEYGQIDRMIADGELPGFELWVIGRWPEEMKWRAARTFPAAHGERLAGLLRQCHLYVTASRWEPCGMHYTEGAQCGLPVVFHEDVGGGGELLSKYGISFRGDGVGAALQAARDRLPELREKVLTLAPSGARMALAYVDILRRLIVTAR
jgi:glycosyltransferase involved in cell wall biosynthesis